MQAPNTPDSDQPGQALAEVLKESPEFRETAVGTSSVSTSP